MLKTKQTEPLSALTSIDWLNSSHPLISNLSGIFWINPARKAQLFTSKCRRFKTCPCPLDGRPNFICLSSLIHTSCHVLVIYISLKGTSWYLNVVAEHYLGPYVHRENFVIINILLLKWFKFHSYFDIHFHPILPFYPIM